jgi:hypothetical protein
MITSSMVELLPFKQTVLGSNPRLSAKLLSDFQWDIFSRDGVTAAREAHNLTKPVQLWLPQPCRGSSGGAFDHMRLSSRLDATEIKGDRESASYLTKRSKVKTLPSAPI